MEFAITMPLLLVLVVGIMDFGGAYNTKQILNNAAREGARYAANQSSLSPQDVETQAAAQAVGNVVQNYLTSAGLTKCTFTPSSYATYVYTYSGGATGCSLVINRGDVVATASGTARCTQVTLGYPYSWTIGRIIGLLARGSSLSLPSALSTDATVQNIF